MKSEGFTVVCYANQSTLFQPAHFFSHAECYCKRGVGWKLTSPLRVQFPFQYM